MNPWLHAAVLLVAGAIAGWVNTVAGGGSLVAVPALIWLGLPADVANGTSRIAILAHGAAAMEGFRKADRLDLALFWPVATPSVAGALLGAYCATLIPNAVFKPVLLGTLAIMGVTLFLRPDGVAPPPGTPALPIAGNRRAQLALFATGVYGGMLQAGVGIVLLFVLGSLLRIDMVRGNALKVAVIFSYTIAVVLIFAAHAKVDWQTGAVLAVGQAFGAQLGVHFSITRSDRTIKRTLFVVIVALCVALMLRS